MYFHVKCLLENMKHSTEDGCAPDKPLKPYVLDWFIEIARCIFGKRMFSFCLKI